MNFNKGIGYSLIVMLALLLGDYAHYTLKENPSLFTVLCIFVIGGASTFIVGSIYRDRIL